MESLWLCVLAELRREDGHPYDPVKAIEGVSALSRAKYCPT